MTRGQEVAFEQITLFGLIIVGRRPVHYGPMLEKELPEAIFCGTLRGEELARHYASGDLFLFPSTFRVRFVASAYSQAHGI